MLGITSASAATFTAGQAGMFTVTTSPGSAGNSPGAVALTETGALPTGVTFTDNGDAGHPGRHPLRRGRLDHHAHGVRWERPERHPDVHARRGSAAGHHLGHHGDVRRRPAGPVTVTTSGFPAPAVAGSGGRLPAGLSFSDNGNGTATLSGTPAAGTEGAYAFTLTASNGVGQAATQSTTLYVDQPPTITSATTTGFTVGVPGHFTVTTGGFPAAALNETGALPAGVTFTDNGDGTATLGGMPAAGTGGSYTFTITASNGAAPDTTRTRARHG